ncbi:MAG: hypothetical protein ACK4RK_04800 [Gemmataceae bacterium]
MLYRRLVLCAAFAFAILVGIGTTQELPDDATTYRAEKARLLAADVALRFDAEVRLNEREQRVNEQLLGLRRALTAKYKQEKRFSPRSRFTP